MFQKTGLVFLLVCLSACSGKKGQKETSPKKSANQNHPALEGVLVLK